MKLVNSLSLAMSRIDPVIDELYENALTIIYHHHSTRILNQTNFIISNAIIREESFEIALDHDHSSTESFRDRIKERLEHMYVTRQEIAWVSISIPSHNFGLSGHDENYIIEAKKPMEVFLCSDEVRDLYFAKRIAE